VILDRDGTVVIDRHYLDDPAGLEFLPGAAQGLRALHERGHPLVVITNQSGIGRGHLTLERAGEINERFAAMVRAAGAELAGLYLCPHRPDEGCACRKPGTQLLLQAARELGFSAADSVVIGDKASDIEFGRRVGALTMLVSRDGLSSEGTPSSADFIVGDLREAAARLAELGSTERAPGSGADAG
jgi:D-glycero-D-manno-heptose 1,7-bisphosphate phosphatase